MRIFVGINISDEARDYCADVAEKLGGKIVPRENFHVTLAFVGETDDAEKVVRAVSGAQFLPAFSYETGGVKSFKNGKIAYLEVGGEQLEKTAEAVYSQLDGCGIDYEKRKFAGHITLRRGKYPPVDIALAPRRFEADNISVFESVSCVSGVKYLPIAAFVAE